MQGRSGTFVRQAEGYSAFVPRPLPPEPAIKLSKSLVLELTEAESAITRLDAAAELLPNPDLFVAMYVRQEAVFSSQIEGTEASLSDVLEFEASGKTSRPQDVEEVINYITALNYGLERVKDFPLSLRLLREIHAELLRGVRGQHHTPGDFRRTQNWIGPAGCTLDGATFVPPPPHLLLEHLGQLETYLHDASDSPLLQAGLAHAQFETIHPFLDGNGRMGRLLITFLLCHRRRLRRPVLYLSHYFKRHRDDYYGHLQAARIDGDWESWLSFLFRGALDVAEAAERRARQILVMLDEHRVLASRQGMASANVHKALQILVSSPVTTARALGQRIDVSPQTVNSIVQRLEELELLIEITGKKRYRVYRYAPYLELFADD